MEWENQTSEGEQLPGRAEHCEQFYRGGESMRSRCLRKADWECVQQSEGGGKRRRKSSSGEIRPSGDRIKKKAMRRNQILAGERAKRKGPHAAAQDGGGRDE